MAGPMTDPCIIVADIPYNARSTPCSENVLGENQKASCRHSLHYDCIEYEAVLFYEGDIKKMKHF